MNWTPEMVPLASLPRELIALTGKQSPGYRKLWTMAVDGRIPVEQVNGRSRTRFLNRQHSTYGWKLRAETWTRRSNKVFYADIYVGEGCFIAGCLPSGLLIHCGEHGTYTNLSQRAWSAVA